MNLSKRFTRLWITSRVKKDWMIGVIIDCCVEKINAAITTKGRIEHGN